MKTFKVIFTMMVLFVIVTGYATETPKMKIDPVSDGKIQVSFVSATRCPVELTITTEDGTIVYYWQSESPADAVNHQVDLKKLGKGTFNVSLNYGCRSINRELCISRKEVKVGPAVQMIEPVFSFRDEKLNVSFLNVANKKVYLNVYKNGQHVDGFTLGKDFDIQKCIDFSNVEKGNYSVVLTDCFKDHYFTVNK